MTVPGIGPIISSAMAAAVGNLRAPESDGRPVLFGGGKRTAWRTLAHGSDLDLASDVPWGPDHFVATPAAIAMFRVRPGTEAIDAGV